MNLAFGTRTSLRELIGSLEEVSGFGLQVDPAPTRPGDVHDSQADGSRLRELFPDIEPVPLDAGLRATVDWMARRRVPAVT